MTSATDVVHVEHAGGDHDGGVDSVMCSFNAATMWMPLKTHGSGGSCAGRVHGLCETTDASNCTCGLPNSLGFVSEGVEVVACDCVYAEYLWLENVWSCARSVWVSVDCGAFLDVLPVNPASVCPVDAVMVEVRDVVSCEVGTTACWAVGHGSLYRSCTIAGDEVLRCCAVYATG